MSDKAVRKAVRKLRDLGLLPRKGGPVTERHVDIFDLVNELAATKHDAGQIVDEVCDEFLRDR